MISGYSIREARVNKLVSQQALAKHLGVSQQMVTYWENRKWVTNGKKILTAIDEVEQKGILSFRVHKTRLIN